MKHFLLKIILFCTVFIGTYFFFIDKLSKNFVDENYAKFTYKAEGLVMGVSRANQGISPEILTHTLKGENSSYSIVNFAFDGYQSFYGKVYLNAIKKKLKDNSTNGIFILSVNPGSFSVQKNMENDTILQMDENLILGKISRFNDNPNYNYIINCYSNSLYNCFLNDNKFSNLIAHSNGWKEIKKQTKEYTISSTEVTQWKNETLKKYSELANTKSFNKTRFNYLIKTIAYLKGKGKVFLVRMPIDKEVLRLENNNWKDFDFEFDSIAKANNIPYFNYSANNANLKTYDGSHLFSKSAKDFSNILSNDIKAYLNIN